MRVSISLLLFATLALIAFAHARWARRLYWPFVDAEHLSKYVVGIPARPGMPPENLTWMVVAALSFAALDALALGFDLDAAVNKGAAWIGAGLVAVFGLRGLAGYTPFWRSAHSVFEFSLIDKIFYSPLCVLVAEGFYVLVSERLWP